MQEKIALDEEGRPFVTDITGGTEPGTYDFRVTRVRLDALSYGVGAVILAAPRDIRYRFAGSVEVYSA